jgi:DNA-directed RNA polymerase specialized sigma24 family protein
MVKVVLDKNLAKIIEILKNKNHYVFGAIKRFDIGYEKADNYFSEVLLKLLERGTDFTTINSQYIYSCMNNIIIDKEIRDVKKIQYFNDFTFANNIVDDRSLVVIYSYKNVRKHIYDLRDNHKRHLILKFAFGMKHVEIAEFLDEPLGTAAPVIMRAQNILRNKVLTDKFKEEQL